MKDLYSKVVGSLRLEAAAIERAAERLDIANTEKAAALVRDCEAKVIVIGVGKSGVIAQKIAQTMTSTGTVAIYLHPSDALHGSLGVVSAGDVAILLSNSGETDELLALIPAIKSRQVPIIAIVGNIVSTLAAQSDVVIDASVDREACPLNLAPTASTTVSLALGDALAMAVMEEKGLTEESFAANHPAGRLGRRLTITVKDLMMSCEPLKQDAGWLEVVKEISKNSLGAVNIVDDDNKLIGIVTDGDLRRNIERSGSGGLDGLTAKTMMTPKPTTAEPGMLAFAALRLMEERPSQITVLPVIDGDEVCLGMIRLHDIIRSGL